MLRHHRLRALLAVTAVAALTATGLAVAGPASAADSSVQWRPGAAQSGVGIWSDKCSNDEPASSSLNSDHAGVANITRPAVVAGSGDETSWQFSTSASTEVGPSATVGKTLTGVSLDVNGSATGRLVVRYVKSTLLGNYVRYATAPVTVSNGSYTATASTKVSVYGQLLSSTQKVPSISTLGEVVDDLDSGTTGTLAIEVGCSSTPVTMDHFKVKTSSGTTDYDMDKATSTAILSAASSSVAGGSSLALAISVRDDYTKKAPSGTVELQAKEAGSSGFETIATLPASTTSYTVAPTTTTQYQLVYGGSTATEASTSSAVSVSVTTGITATASSRYVVKGKTYKVAGSTSPAQPGATVTLQRCTSASSCVNLATTKTNASGTYSFTVKATTRGSQAMRVVLGSNEATSSAFVVTTLAQGKVWMKLKPHKPRPHKKVKITGTIKPARATKVQIQRYKAKSKKWKAIGVVKSNAKGHFKFKLKTHKPKVILLRAATPASGDITTGISKQKMVVVTAKTRTTARLSTHTTTVGKIFHVRGQVKPKHKGAVYLQILANRKWVTISGAATSRKGKYNIKAEMVWSGVWKVRVLLAPSTGYSGSHSRTSTLTVRPLATTSPSSSSSSSNHSSGSSTGGVGHG